MNRYRWHQTPPRTDFDAPGSTPREILSPVTYDLRSAFISAAARALWTVWFRDRIEDDLMPRLYRQASGDGVCWIRVETDRPEVQAILEGDEDWLTADIVKEAQRWEGMSEEACWETMDRIADWDGWTPLTLKEAEEDREVDYPDGPEARDYAMLMRDGND